LTAKKRDAIFTPRFIEDLTFWVNSNPKTAAHVLKLVEAVLRDPTAGIGKPERLSYFTGNVWSRRINKEHRLVYRMVDDRIEFLQARYHYEK
jgi:toxin YoeB